MNRLYNKFFLLLISMLLCFVTIISGCNKKDNITEIRGNLSNASNSMVVLMQIIEDNIVKIDSTKTDSEGNFYFNILHDADNIYRLNFGNNQFVMLVLKPNQKVDFSANAEDVVNTCKISGSPDSENYLLFNQTAYNNYAALDSLTHAYREIKGTDDFETLKPLIDKSFNEVILSQNQEARDYVKNNIKSLSSLLVVNNRFANRPMLNVANDFELLKALSDSLMLCYPENELVKGYSQRLIDFEKSRNVRAENVLKLGDKVPNIELPDMSDQTMSLYSIEDKLVIVYFWSIYDNNSRMINKQLTTLHAELNKEVQIFSVSLDNDIQKWKEAIQQDKAYWIQTIDSRGVQSEYLQKYGVSIVPTMFLLDYEKKVLAINPSPALLKERIGTAIGSKGMKVEIENRYIQK
ncbi:MAG: TlpA disulfide reductase family protein [Lentimicrobiaceae bacterium]|nr:TlpA disulfide reductase family protein [Lentimicrobiaceae bacterium]